MTNICVSGDTVLDIKIGDEYHKSRMDEIGELLKLENEVYVLSKNLTSNEEEWKLITNFGMTDSFSEVYEIEDVTTGKTIKCTEDHLLCTQRGWVKAKDLSETDTLVVR